MTETVHCCICDRPITGEVRRLGDRAYCADHFAALTRERKSASWSILIHIGAVVLFAALIYLVVDLANIRLSGFGLVLAGLVIALFPALVWLVAFYRQDRLEPEPKHFVLGVFVLGALLAAAIGQPLIRDVFHIGDWLYDGPVTGLLGSIFIIGFIQEFLKYAAVRYTVYPSREFDERVDGIIYGAAAGLGYATMTNLHYVLDNGGVALGMGALQVAILALAHASFAGVTGYFLGRAKFESMGPLWLPVGLTVAAILNGVVSSVIRQAPLLGADLQGSTFNPWIGVVVAAVVAGATFAFLFTIINRLNARTLATIRPQGA